MHLTSLIHIINDFLQGLDVIYENSDVFQQFYDYLQMKYIIPCELGMLFIEKITTNNLFKTYITKLILLGNCGMPQLKLKI